ncbi:MAG: sugar phosphate isomerase/epimerase family protein [Chryseolinea sp.]
MKLLSIFLSCLLAYHIATAQQKVIKPQIGIAQDFEQDSLLSAVGYHHLVESISKCLSPLKFTDEQFDAKVEIYRQLKVPIYALNIFMPGELKLVGPEVREADVLSYANKVFERCQRMGVTMVVWGSGGARRVPDGFDPKTAKKQFIQLAQKVAAAAAQYNVRMALENLNHTETNFINTVAEALDVVKRVDHPNFLLCADIYHMLKEGEPAEILIKAKPFLIHCDIAEKDGRTPPGVRGDNFSSYLDALRRIHYSGVIVLECRWSDIATQAATARINLQRQIDAAYDRK